MAIDINTGFNLGAGLPLDDRIIKQTTTERDALITDGLAYEGLEVYCLDTKLKYRYNGTTWEEDKNNNVWTGTKEEYNAITDKNDDITYIVTDEEDNLDINSLVIDDTKTSDNTTWSSKKINEENKEIYSTDEVKTNKIWIDGKPIYRKVVTQTITTSGAENIISGFDTSLIDTMISFYGSIKQSWGNIAPISYYNSEEDGAYIYMSKESNRNRFVLNARTTGDVILIVEYTKTTD